MIPGFTVGRMVHFVHETGTHCAAIIVAIGNNADMGECELQVAIPQFGWMQRTHVFYQPDRKEPGTWHYIEQVA